MTKEELSKFFGVLAELTKEFYSPRLYDDPSLTSKILAHIADAIAFSSGKTSVELDFLILQRNLKSEESLPPLPPKLVINPSEPPSVLETDIFERAVPQVRACFSEPEWAIQDELEWELSGQR